MLIGFEVSLIEDEFLNAVIVHLTAFTTAYIFKKCYKLKHLTIIGLHIFVMDFTLSSR